MSKKLSTFGRLLREAEIEDILRDIFGKPLDRDDELPGLQAESRG